MKTKPYLSLAQKRTLRRLYHKCLFRLPHRSVIKALESKGLVVTLGDALGLTVEGIRIVESLTQYDAPL